METGTMTSASSNLTSWTHDKDAELQMTENRSGGKDLIISLKTDANANVSMGIQESTGPDAGAGFGETDNNNAKESAMDVNTENGTESHTNANDNGNDKEEDMDQSHEDDEEDYDEDEEDFDENLDDSDDLFFNFDDHFGEAEPLPPPKKPEKKPEELEKAYYGFAKFSFVEKAPKTHKFASTPYHPSNDAEFKRAFQRDYKLLDEGLPDGIFVRSFEDRMDLMSALIEGPANTPYEGGLFSFDLKLPDQYPHRPPQFYFISFTKERMNPNLYATCGKVCVSLLGTWQGSHACEKWSKDSSILQVLLSIQGLILVPEPFFNEPGYTQDPKNMSMVQKSRQYNQTAILLLLKAMAAKLENPPLPFQFEITYILKIEIPKTIARLESWMKQYTGTMLTGTPTPTPSSSAGPCPGPSHSAASSKEKEGGGDGNKNDEIKPPGFPLLPFNRIFDARAAIEVLKDKHKKYCSL